MAGHGEALFRTNQLRGRNPIRALNIGIAGAGRMGRAIIQAADGRADLNVVAIWVRDEQKAVAELENSNDILASKDLERVVAMSDVIVDFSLPEGTACVLDAAARQGKPLVCGVSGLSDEDVEALDEAAGKIAVVYDRNMSPGIAILERSVRDAAKSLGPDFDVEITETHHIHKKDAPSGTALKLGEAIAKVRGDRGTGPVRYSVERRGEVPGDHEVIMTSATERLTFAHSVTTRQVFADGALRAACWAARQAPGRYTMQDVLFAQ